jgi:hypothetical protein
MQILLTTADKAPLPIEYVEPQTNHQGIHTNNYTKSWHWMLKTSYLNPSDQLRINEVGQILTDKVEAHYKWAQLQVEGGFAAQTTNQFQQREKLLADVFTPEELQLLGMVCSENPTGVRATIHCKSNRPDRTKFMGIDTCSSPSLLSPTPCQNSIV